MKLVFLRDEDRRRIEAAVCEAERRTTAELVTVIADASGGYHYMPTLLAAAAVFVLSGLALLLPIRWEFAAFYAAQVFLFIGLALTLNWRPVRFRIVPRSVQRRQAHLLAHEQFLDLGLSSTAARTGLMLFVSAAEHYVEIIADRGIREKVDDTAWGVSSTTSSPRCGRHASPTGLSMRSRPAPRFPPGNSHGTRATRTRSPIR